MKKRSCQRFTIPGATLSYKKKKLFFFDKEYSTDSFPVINLSKGGAKFLCHEKLSPGKAIKIQLQIPGFDKIGHIVAQIRWIAKNPEQSYRYQVGISFYSFGTQKNKNPLELLAFLTNLEKDRK